MKKDYKEIYRRIGRPAISRILADLDIDKSVSKRELFLMPCKKTIH